MFKKRLLELFEKRNITAYKLAKDTGISQGLMGEYKKGIKQPTIQNLYKIADYFNVSVDYLLGRTDYPEINNGKVIIDGKIIEGTVEQTSDGWILRRNKNK